MYWMILNFASLIFQKVKLGYQWFTGGLFRLAFFVSFLAFGTAITTITARNLGASFFWELGVFMLGCLLTVRVATKARTIIESEE
ncbi:MAG: hypothetical protein ABJN14_01355 [Paracoccaceae bacterium]